MADWPPEGGGGGGGGVGPSARPSRAETTVLSPSQAEATLFNAKLGCQRVGSGHGTSVKPKPDCDPHKLTHTHTHTCTTPKHKRTIPHKFKSSSLETSHSCSPAGCGLWPIIDPPSKSTDKHKHAQTHKGGRPAQRRCTEWKRVLIFLNK